MPSLTNNFSHPVILEDDRDPYESWRNHIARGSAGGVDLAYPCGTPVLAIAAGTIDNVPNNGTGGNTCAIRTSDGSRVEYMHLSRFALSDDDRVNVGDLIGYSGNTNAAGPAYACHLHVHVYVGGVRRNVWDFFTATAGGGSSTPLEDELTPEQNNALMSVYQAVFAGGGDAGSESIIARLVEIEKRVKNLDQQVAGADGFDNPNGSQQSVAGRVIDIQKKVSKA